MRTQNEENAHSPGPWCASVGAGYVAVMVGRAIDSTLAITTTCTPEGVANARLMAAAPTMLDALQRLIPWACKAMSDGVHMGCAAPNDLNASINLARYAMARATGRPVAQGEATQPNPDPSQPRPDPLDVLRDGGTMGQVSLATDAARAAIAKARGEA